MDLNKVMLIGNVTKDPEARQTPQGTSVVTFTIATNKSWNDQSGMKQEKVEYHNIVAWRKAAELVQQLVKKGNKVFVEGELQTRSWDDPTGVKKYRTEIVLSNFILLTPKGAGSGNYSFDRSGSADPFGDMSQAQGGGPVDEIRLEDVPF